MPLKSLTVIRTHFPLKRSNSERQSGECDMMTDPSLCISGALICSRHVLRCEEKAEQKHSTDAATVICVWSKKLDSKELFSDKSNCDSVKSQWLLSLDTSTGLNANTAPRRNSFPGYQRQYSPVADACSGVWGLWKHKCHKKNLCFFLVILSSPALPLSTFVSQPGVNICSLVMILHCHLPPGSHFVWRWSWRRVEVRVKWAGKEVACPTNYSLMWVNLVNCNQISIKHNDGAPLWCVGTRADTPQNTTKIISVGTMWHQCIQRNILLHFRVVFVCI